MVVLEVTLSLAGIAVCCTGVGILLCCIVWLKHSESVWTKAEKEEEMKTQTKKEELGHLKTKRELYKRTGFTNMRAYEIPVRSSGTTSTGLAANSVETAQNEAYTETRHLVHTQLYDSQINVTDINGTSNTEIKTVQNTSYKPTTHSQTTGQGQTSNGSTDDESMYTYISSDQVNSVPAINIASNVAYIRSYHQHTLDVIYEETQPDSVASRDKTQAQSDSDYNSNACAYTKSETLL